MTLCIEKCYERIAEKAWSIGRIRLLRIRIHWNDAVQLNRSRSTRYTASQSSEFFSSNWIHDFRQICIVAIVSTRPPNMGLLPVGSELAAHPSRSGSGFVNRICPCLLNINVGVIGVPNEYHPRIMVTKHSCTAQINIIKKITSKSMMWI